MTRMDDKIELKGSAAEIHRDTGTSEDSYGDVIPVWAKQADEYVWVQPMRQELLKLDTGIYDANDQRLFFKSTTIALQFDKVVIGAVEYIVQTIRDVPGGTGTSHKIAVGKLIS